MAGQHGCRPLDFHELAQRRSMPRRVMSNVDIAILPRPLHEDDSGVECESDQKESQLIICSREGTGDRPTVD